MRVARTMQHLLPLLFLVVGYLELAALMPVPFDTLQLAGTASLLGPASFLPVTLAVVWAALLPGSRFSLAVKVVTSLGAVGFTVARAVLVIVWWMAAEEVGWSTGVLMVAGLLLGVSLSAWAFVDAIAMRGALRTPTTPRDAGAAVLPEAGEPESPTTPTRPPAVQPPSPVWQSVSTPWPRRDESDPNGTLIRPPAGRGTSR